MKKMINRIWANEGLSFNDVLIIPAYSEIMPKKVNIAGKFSRNIDLPVPLVSAAMDTVTEATMAIAIASEGGIGVIHKNMSIEDQAKQVEKTKRAENGMILDPLKLECGATVQEAIQMMEEYGIGGIPVVADGESMRLAGILTNRDLRFEKDMGKVIDHVMTTQQLITIRVDQASDPELIEKLLHKHRIEKLPVVDQDRKLVGLVTYKDLTKATQHPYACKDDRGRLRVAAAVGITDDMMERVAELVNAGVDAVVLDTAHGHSKGVVVALEKIKKQHSGIDVVVGNIATAKAARKLMQAGADALKVGIGPGSICTTRIVAGIGVPQFTAIANVAEEVNGHVPIIGDGGIKYSGDINKALAAGSTCVMMGSVFAGVDESPGTHIISDGRKFKVYRGMGSTDAMQQGSSDRYFQDGKDAKKLVAEGVVGKVPYKGTLDEVVYQLVGGIRAGMGYAGAKDLSALQKCEFVRITGAALNESHPHGVYITKEEANYSPEKR